MTDRVLKYINLQSIKLQFYYKRMDKYQISKQFRKIEPSNLSFTRYNLCFSYSNSKQLRKKQNNLLKPNMKRQSADLAKRNTNLVAYLPRKTNSSVYMQSHSSTFYPERKKRQSQYLLPEQFYPNDEVDYIKSGFPQGKKKSGQQQLLKLLLKFTDNLQPTRPQMVHPGKSPLYQNPQNTKGIIPKLKARTRFNWIKDRYCINRNRQGDGDIIPQTERPVYPHSLSRNMGAMRRNMSLLKAQ